MVGLVDDFRTFEHPVPNGSGDDPLLQSLTPPEQPQNESDVRIRWAARALKLS